MFYVGLPYFGAKSISLMQSTSTIVGHRGRRTKQQDVDLAVSCYRHGRDLTGGRELTTEIVRPDCSLLHGGESSYLFDVFKPQMQCDQHNLLYRSIANHV